MSMVSRIAVSLMTLLSVALLGACSGEPDGAGEVSAPAVSEKAVTFCREHAGVMRDGSCVFADGSSCDPQLYLQAKCAPGDNPAAAAPE